MLWSFDIGRIAGTAIKVHITFVLFLAWIAVARAGSPEDRPPRGRRSRS